MSTASGSDRTDRKKARSEAAKAQDEGFHFLKERVWSVEEGEEAVYCLVDELLTRATNEGLERRLNILTYPFTIDKVLEDCMEVLRWACITHDLGEHDLSVESSWNLDDEPPPVPIDSWARGAVPVRTAPPPALRDTPLTSVQRKRHTRPTTGSMTSGGLGSSKDDPLGDVPSTAGSTRTRGEKLATIPSRPNIRDAKIGKTSQPSTAASQPEQPPPPKPRTELKTKDAVQKRERPTETAIFVVTQTINPEQLPAQFVQVKLDVKDPVLEEPPKRRLAFGAPKKKPKPAAAVKKGPQLEIHRPLPVEAVPSSGVGTLTLQAGVTLKEARR